jgi:hypothetical protein
MAILGRKCLQGTKTPVKPGAYLGRENDAPLGLAPACLPIVILGRKCLLLLFGLCISCIVLITGVKGYKTFYLAIVPKAK